MDRLEILEKMVKKHAADIAMLQKMVIPQEHKEFEELQKLLNSSLWPAAVPPDMICDITSEQDKEDRAEGILDVIIDVHLENKRFLDFGCGSGHVINRSLIQNPELSVGYDIQSDARWNSWPINSKTIYTNNWDEVEKNGLYDVVAIYDVLDHISDEKDVIINLRKIKKVLAVNGKVFIRCHPWTSRHGSHLYKIINKAFIHLVFTQDELEKLNYKPEIVQKVIHPLATYKNWFELAGFKLHHKEQITNADVENFFQTNTIVSKRIKSNWIESTNDNLRSGNKFPLDQLKFQFIDYCLI